MFSDKQTIMQTKLMFQIFKEFHERQEQEIRERPAGGAASAGVLKVHTHFPFASTLAPLRTLVLN